MKVAIHQPEDATALHEVLFDDPLCRAAYLARSSWPTLAEAVEHAGSEAAVLLQRLAVEEFDLESDKVIGRLAQVAAGRELKSIVAAALAAGEIQQSEETRWLHELVELPDPGVEVAEALVPWLLDRLQVEA